jgi:hypothetical protein
MEVADQLGFAIEKQHRGVATFIQSVPVRETYRNGTVWEGTVHVFRLAGHPRAKRACLVIADRGKRQTPILRRTAYRSD